METKPYTVVERYSNGIEKREYPGGEFLEFTVSGDICEMKPAMKEALSALRSLIHSKTTAIVNTIFLHKLMSYVLVLIRRFSRISMYKDVCMPTSLLIAIVCRFQMG